MLDTHPREPIVATLDSKDLDSYAELDAVAREVGARDVVEFWKSAAFPLNLMDDYVLTREFEKRARSSSPIPLRSRLSGDQVRAYGRIDPGNARLRGLIARLEEEGAWKCLWVPPSLPCYTPSRPFSDVTLKTKRLVFSEWQVVPKVIAALTSYHVDTAILSHAGTLGQPLQWRAGGRMAELALLVPSTELARLTDPLVLARDLGDGDGPAQRQRVLAEAQRKPTLSRASRNEVNRATEGDEPSRHRGPDLAGANDRDGRTAKTGES
jgi:hypothetical protein